MVHCGPGSWQRDRMAAPVSGSATGVHSTCSMRGAPVASITSRSKPSATPLAGGIVAQARRGNPRRSDSARRRAAPSRPSPPRTGGAARPGRSVRRSRWRARPRRHRARTARRRAGRTRFGRASAASHDRILVEDRRPADPELRLDPLDQDAAENVGPGIVVGDADAGAPRALPPARRGPAAAAAASPAGRCRRSARTPRATRQPLRRGERIAAALAERRMRRAAGRLGGRARPAAPRSRPSALVGLIRAVPFQHA